ncbi:MAG TPA: hypothetical protein VJ906_11075 [Roseovarius sp.]|nr:hypothetical protein [Roseovarius sp.]
MQWRWANISHPAFDRRHVLWQAAAKGRDGGYDIMVTKSFMILDDEAPAQTKPGLNGQASATGRYEFRVWPHDMPQAAALLQQSWSLVGAERRKDLYLLTENSPLRLVKLRSGNRLEVKSRRLDHGPLQHWTHHAYPLFPLSRTALQALAESLDLTGLPPDAGRSPGHLVARLGDMAPAILPMTVSKSRLLFREGSSRAEICRVTVAGWSRLTLAIEDPDPDSALARLDVLRLGHMPNRSYGDVLSRRRLAAARAPLISHPVN